jgi:tyrosine-protein phosphatase YwqE
VGLFGNIFRKREPVLEPADISNLQVDLHSHLIPGIDDGSQSLDETLDMLKRFHEMGYRKVITTPHVMSDFYRNTPEIILNGLSDVRQAIVDQGLNIEIEASAEYYLDDAFEKLIEKDELLPFGTERYILFELPFIAEPLNLSSAIFNLQLKEYKPILAHPERYGFWYGDYEKLASIHDKGVLLQLNINSLSGYYGPEAKKVCEWLINKDMVSFLGTDCHRMEHLDVYQELTCKTPAFHRLLENGKLLNKSL